jgi:hypothetical protein
MLEKRYLFDYVLDDLEEKMVFIGKLAYRRPFRLP